MNDLIDVEEHKNHLQITFILVCDSRQYICFDLDYFRQR